jgi:UDPglucose 6-dehydrogenase
LLGLTYKPGTDTLRRSSAIELARALHTLGFRVVAHDPAIATLPPELNFITLVANAATLTRGAAALVVGTEWPAFREHHDWPTLIGAMRHPVVIDATRFLSKSLQGIQPLTYLTVGSPA